MISFSEILRERMTCPTVGQILESSGARLAVVDIRSNVSDAALTMREHKSSAVLVMEDARLIGIFTTKDIVLRVLASSLDPMTTSVIRVHTPHPDTIQGTTIMLDALKKMHGKWKGLFYGRNDVKMG